MLHAACTAMQTALSYLRIREEPSLRVEDKQAVESWMYGLASKHVRGYYVDLMASYPGLESSNHFYWAGV